LTANWQPLSKRTYQATTAMTDAENRAVKQAIRTTILLIAVLALLLPVAALEQKQSKAALKEAALKRQREKLDFIAENINGYERVIADGDVAILAFNHSNGAWKLVMPETRDSFTGTARLSDDGCTTTLMDLGSKITVRLEMNWCGSDEEGFVYSCYVHVEGASPSRYFPTTEFNLDDERASLNESENEK
jgi:hypothetical protein